MEKFKNFVCKYQIIDFVIIAVFVTIFSFLFSHNLSYLVMDRGREFLFPQEILNGNVPYRDIHLIYFPTAYYINAAIYKLLGISIDSLIISQTVICICYVFVYFLTARIFLGEKASQLLALLVISSCIFNTFDIFSFIVPYSYARAYGIMTFSLCTFLLIKLLKTDNINYLYAAALTSGFCFVFKFEFFIAYILLLFALFLYKKLNLIQYLKIFLLSLIFPVILFLFLLLQGVSVNDMLAAADFGCKFSKTPVMMMFLSESGMYPALLGTKLKEIMKYTPYLLLIILISFTAFKIQLKYSKKLILPLTAVIMWTALANIFGITEYWIYLPVLILAVLCFKYKELYADNKPVMLIIVSALLCAQRDFFYHSMSSYGTYSSPLLFLALYIIIKTYLPKVISGISTEKLTDYIIFILIGLHVISLGINKINMCFPIHTNKGTVYSNSHNYYIFNKTLSFIENNINSNDSILVLPEGHIFNYLTDRKVNLKCHMMDRLYHDAYGQENAKDKIASTNSDYIILLYGVRHKDFYRPYLYGKGESLAGNYIDQNYKMIKEINSGSSMTDRAFVFKKVK